jgi:hypothetical protein
MYFTSSSELCVLPTPPSCCIRCQQPKLPSTDLSSGSSLEVSALIALPNSLAYPHSQHLNGGRSFYTPTGSAYRFSHPLDVFHTSKSGRPYFVPPALSGFASQSILPGRQYLVPQAYPPTLLAPVFTGSSNLEVLLPASNRTSYLAVLRPNSHRLFLCKVFRNTKVEHHLQSYTAFHTGNALPLTLLAPQSLSARPVHLSPRVFPSAKPASLPQPESRVQRNLPS